MPEGSPPTQAEPAPIVSIVAIGLIVLAAGGVGYLLSTFLFAFSGSQSRMVGIVNAGALVMVALGVGAGAVAWRLGRASAAIKWTAITTGIGWLATMVVEFVLSFSLGA